MTIEPGHNPVEPDTPDQRDPIHHPQPLGPGQGDGPAEDDEEDDTASEPWWMRPLA